MALLTWMVKFPSIGTHRLYLLNKFPDRQGPPVTKLPGFGFREIIKKQWDHYILADGKDDNQTTAHCPLYEVYKKMLESRSEDALVLLVKLVKLLRLLRLLRLLKLLRLLRLLRLLKLYRQKI